MKKTDPMLPTRAAIIKRLTKVNKCLNKILGVNELYLSRYAKKFEALNQPWMELEELLAALKNNTEILLWNKALSASTK